MPKQASTNNYLFLGTHGHVMAIDQTDGSTIWKTSLPKTGFQAVVMMVENGKLLCATAGRAFAVDPVNGKILWENHLPGLGQGVVGMCTVNQSSPSNDAMMAQLAAQAAASSAAT
ncbi:MAG: outer membrane protein assembly factor BamB [Planctomycetota bacterium]|jgi:outer membrane protein assembly factor BamB